MQRKDKEKSPFFGGFFRDNDEKEKIKVKREKIKDAVSGKAGLFEWAAYGG